MMCAICSIYYNCIEVLKEKSELLTVIIAVTFITNPSFADIEEKIFLKIEEKNDITVYIGEIDNKYISSIITNTPWHDDLAKYTGVTLENFLQQYGDSEISKISISAMNGYIVDEDIGTFVNAGAMLVWLMNDHPISVHNKGPIIIVFPWYQNNSLRQDFFTSLAVWHVKSIHIK